jgi:hypothetical protein
MARAGRGRGGPDGAKEWQRVRAVLALKSNRSAVGLPRFYSVVRPWRGESLQNCAKYDAKNAKKNAPIARLDIMNRP